MKLKKFILILFILIISSAKSQIIYVDSAATGTNDGTSWLNAFTDLNNALANTNENDSVWVAKGTYKPTTGTDRLTFFNVPYGVCLFGNFIGNETSLNQRGNIMPDSSGISRINETILSGDIGVLNDTSDNSYHVIYSVLKSGTGTRLYMDGFKVVNGVANHNYHNFGAGIYCGTSATNSTSSLTVTNCIVSNNYATYNGAGVESFSHYDDAYLTISNSVVRENHTDNIYSDGSGVSCLSRIEESQVRVENCFIIHNSTKGNGAGVFSETYSTSNLSIITIIGSTIKHNNCSGGGSVVCATSTNSSSIIRLINSDISNNTSNSAILNTAGGNTYTSVYNSLLSNNVSNNEGGVIVTGAYNVGFNSRSYINIYHSTIAENIANHGGGGIYPYTYNVDVTVENSIIYGNKNGALESNIEFKNPSNITTNINYSLVENYSSILGYNGNNNLNTNPLFTSPINNDFTLQSISPAINQGDSSLLTNDFYDIDNDADYSEQWPIDLKGIRRVFSSNIDMGAYENYCSIAANLSDTACDFYNTPSGIIYNSTGTYLDTVLSSTNCDSIITIALTIKNSTSSTITDTLMCASAYTSPSGNSYIYNGTYLDTVPNSVGCDSLITINLSGGKSEAFLTQTDCDSLISPSGNYMWTATGIYSDTLTNSFNCDSVINVNLTINHTTTENITINACNNYTSPSTNYTWTSSGNYIDTIGNVLGCDSLLYINLSITTIDTSVNDTFIAQVGTVLSANALGAAYQWINCTTGNYILGAVNQNLITIPGNSYAVEITQNGCIDTSSCYNVISVNIDENNLTRDLIYYPNPTNDGDIFISFKNKSDEVHLKISNTLGQIISSNTYQSKDLIKANLIGPSGFYFLEVKTSDGQSKVLKVLKK